MLRSAFPLAFLFLFLRAVAATRGQNPREGAGQVARALDADLTGPQAIRDLARARFAASRADARTVAVAKRDAARECFEARFREFLAGRGTLIFLHESAHDLLDAELALNSEPADQLLVLETYWAIMHEVERVNRARYDAGRIPISDMMESTYHQLGAEVQMLRASAKYGKTAGLLTTAHAHPELEGVANMKALARAKFAASRITVEALTRAQVDAARQQLEARLREYLAGRGTTPFLLESSTKLLLAKCALFPDPADQVPFFEDHWLQTWEAERINQGRYDGGRIPIQDLVSSRYARLEAGLWLMDARVKAGSPPLRHVEAGLPFDGSDDEGAPRRSALRKRELLSADRQELRRGMRDAAREEVEARMHEFLARRGTLDFLLNSARRLVDSEWALAATRAEQHAALERHWSLVQRIASVSLARYEAGRISIQDWQQSRYHLLRAEEWLLQAREKAAK